jgi:ribosomal protein S18 acetylase RimI-like enzyme
MSSAASSLVFRLARPEDVPQLVSLIEAAYRGQRSRKGWTTEADLVGGQRMDPAGVHAVITNENSCILLAFSGGELVGCCQLERHANDGAYFRMFAVWPERQGYGLGRCIVTEAERIARDDWTATEMRMHVIEQRTDLIAWYERIGYRRTGATAPFPYGDARAGVPKRNDLRFLVFAKPLVTDEIGTAGILSTPDSSHANEYSHAVDFVASIHEAHHLTETDACE